MRKKPKFNVGESVYSKSEKKQGIILSVVDYYYEYYYYLESTVPKCDYNVQFKDEWLTCPESDLISREEKLKRILNEKS